jgi:hypothetical protein
LETVWLQNEELTRMCRFGFRSVEFNDCLTAK